MKRGITYLISAILAILVIFLIIYMINSKPKFFSQLIVTYQNDKKVYDKISIDDVIAFNDVSFWIVGISNDQITINSSTALKDQKETKSSFVIKLGESKALCNAKNSCIYFELK